MSCTAEEDISEHRHICTGVGVCEEARQGSAEDLASFLNTTSLGSNNSSVFSVSFMFVLTDLQALHMR